MADTHWLDLVKKAAVRAVKHEKPCDYMIGTVTSSKPLKIKFSDGDGLELGADFFHLAENVTDHMVNVTISGSEQKIKMNNALKKGDKVLMIRKWGGQDFIIVDKVVS
ncbi:MAG: DUF2577 domain-containing protein [Eubacterium sp.]|nr:DUF2577 domain-containing protein [Eubacterium sp.]